MGKRLGQSNSDGSRISVIPKFTGNASDLIEWTEACMADRRSVVCRAIE